MKSAADEQKFLQRSLLELHRNRLTGERAGDNQMLVVELRIIENEFARRRDAAISSVGSMAFISQQSRH
jgi:hypothetical protein